MLGMDAVDGQVAQRVLQIFQPQNDNGASVRVFDEERARAMGMEGDQRKDAVQLLLVDTLRVILVEQHRLNRRQSVLSWGKQISMCVLFIFISCVQRKRGSRTKSPG
jgi:hypothetical protein